MMKRKQQRQEIPMTTQAPAGTGSNPRASFGGRAQVLYDGECALCCKSVALLKRLDWLGRLSYVNVREPGQLPQRRPPLDPGRLLDEMHLLTPDGRQLYHGFAAFRWLAWQLPLLWFLVPLLYLPGVPTLGQRAYLWVARNRFRLVPCHGGVCRLPSRTLDSARRLG
jgi:predicted DCC family thiol-disulfide oxidoreductase YuxK